MRTDRYTAVQPHKVQGLVVVEDTKVSRCCESFVRNGTLQYRTTSNTPITQSGIPPLVCLVSWNSQLPQVGHLRFGLLPLLPDIHSEPTPEPFVSKHQRPLHISYTKVSNPTADEHLHFLHYSADIAPAIALCKKFQRFFCLSERLSVYSDIDTMSLLAQTESKKLEFLLCEDTGHLALFRVHFQRQLAFQILPAGFQQAFCCALAFLANTTMSSAYRTSFPPLRYISQSNSLRQMFTSKGDSGLPAANLLRFCKLYHSPLHRFSDTS